MQSPLRPPSGPSGLARARRRSIEESLRYMTSGHIFRGTITPGEHGYKMKLVQDKKLQLTVIFVAALLVREAQVRTS